MSAFTSLRLWRDAAQEDNSVFVLTVSTGASDWPRSEETAQGETVGRTRSCEVPAATWASGTRPGFRGFVRVRPAHMRVSNLVCSPSKFLLAHRFF